MNIALLIAIVAGLYCTNAFNTEKVAATGAEDASDVIAVSSVVKRSPQRSAPAHRERHNTGKTPAANNSSGIFQRQANSDDVGAQADPNGDTRSIDKIIAHVQNKVDKIAEFFDGIPGRPCPQCNIAPAAQGSQGLGPNAVTEPYQGYNNNNFAVPGDNQVYQWWVQCSIRCPHLTPCYNNWMNFGVIYNSQCCSGYNPVIGRQSQECQSCLINSGLITTTAQTSAPMPTTTPMPAPKVCTCKRIQTLKTVTVSRSCSTSTGNGGVCSLADQNARVTSTDQSMCSCLRGGDAGRRKMSQ